MYLHQDSLSVIKEREGKKKRKTALPRELSAGCFPRVIAVVRDCNLVLPSYVELQYANVISLHHQHRGTAETEAVRSGFSDKHLAGRQPIITRESYTTSNEMFS